MVVEEGPSFLHFVAKNSPPLPFVISAKDPSTFFKLINLYIDSLKRPSTLENSLSDISHAMTARRFRHPFMISVQADSHMDLARKLQDGPPIIESSANRKPREAAF
jgi:acyl transferase domain-containing protein